MFKSICKSQKTTMHNEEGHLHTGFWSNCFLEIFLCDKVLIESVTENRSSSNGNMELIIAPFGLPMISKDLP